MKRLLVVCLAACLVVAGCGVMVNAKYRELMDKTAVASDVTAQRVEKAATDAEVFLTANPNQPPEVVNMVDNLRFAAQACRLQATTWQSFRDARDGKETP